MGDSADATVTFGHNLTKKIETSVSVPPMADVKTFGVSAMGSFYTIARVDDPYIYQTGFGNRFASESM